MRQEHRLGVLEVGPAGHGHAEVPGRLVDQRVHDVQDEPGDGAGLVAQVPAEEGDDLVVARPPRAQPTADLGAGPLDEPALQRRVDVLVGGVRAEVAARDVGVQPVERVEHGRERGVVEQPGGVQDPRVRTRPGDVVPGQPPVEVRAPRQLGERVGGSTGEAAAPEADPPVGGRFRNPGHAPALRDGSSCRTKPRAAAGEVPMTRIVSSPAMVPRTSERWAWSMHEAR